MQIIVQSAVIPWKENLIIMDAIRAPIAQVFSIVETISNYQLKTGYVHRKRLKVSKALKRLPNALTIR